MALVDSDLFLIQDATTKANYKLSFENLTREIALDIDLDTVYVEVAGDNMTGDLTLGPAGSPSITLAATLGNGTFSGTLYAEYAQITERINGSNGLFIYGDVSSPNGIELESDGDINIGGKLTVSNDIQAGPSDPTQGTAGVLISRLGQIHATESGSGKVFSGRQTGSATPTSTILGNGDASFVNIDASDTISAIQTNSTNINSSGNITANGSVNAGIGDNLITLDGGTGEITGGANVFIDGGTYT